MKPISNALPPPCLLLQAVRKRCGRGDHAAIAVIDGLLVCQSEVTGAGAEGAFLSAGRGLQSPLLMATAICIAAPSAMACEPVIPFMMVVAGPMAFAGSLAGLGVAVALKCLTFALLQRPLSAIRAVVYMFIGNVLTTIIGFFAAAMIGHGSFWLIGIPLVWYLCWLPSTRVVRIASRPWLARLSPGVLAVAMTGGLVASCILFSFGQAAIVHNRLVLYWIGKLVAIYVALIVSILLSAFWEEWVIWGLSKLPQTETSFVRPVLRANLYVLLVIMTFAAAIMLPKRLKSPDFLVHRGATRMASVSR